MGAVADAWTRLYLFRSLYPDLAPSGPTSRALANLFDINRTLAAVVLVVAFVTLRRHLLSGMVSTSMAMSWRGYDALR